MSATGGDLQASAALTASGAQTQPPMQLQAQASSAPAPAASAPRCANCGAPVPGRYCSECGQRLEHSLHTVWHFLREATEDLTHADSRIWRTILALLFKPGYLTREFLDGRRARYLPPLRVYLVLSVGFFLLAGATRHEPTLIVASSNTEGHSLTLSLKTLPDLNAPGGQSGHPPDTARSSGAPSAQATDANSGAKPDRWALRPGETPAQRAKRVCEQMKFEGVFDRYFAPQVCHNLVESGGRGLEEQILHNVARAMFVFLPVFAVIMKLIYRRPRRYYVEHLLYLVHTHACAFLLFSLYLLIVLLPWKPVGVCFQVIATVYFLYYLYSSMRRVYGQGRLLTLSKLAVLGLAYLVFGSLTIAVASVYSVMTLA